MNNQFKLLGKSSNFLGIPVLDNWEEAEVIIIPLPLELTTTYMKGTRGGPGALLEASHQVELFDEELEIEPSDAEF